MSMAYGTQRTSVQPRFWNPHGTELRLSPDGFLWNPLDDFQRHLNPAVVQLADRRDSQCLVLLGEPGSGKSTSLDIERVELHGDSPQETILFFDLAECATEDAIRNGVFGHPAWQSWREGGNLTLFLDSYDECRLSLRTVGNVLVREFRNLGHRERLKLRVACRAGVWPAHLEQQLVELWPSRVAVYDLAPLRRQDAEAMLLELGVEDIQTFTRSVQDVDATPMLSSPLSLQMLADIYLRTDSLPARREQLFEQGCRALCTEQNRSRDAAGFRGTLDPAQRFLVAARIAALTMLCGRIGVWTGLEHERPADAPYLTIRDMSGGLESVDGVDFSVSVEAIREVVGETRLFTPHGADRFGWMHRTYAEFLAARYLLVHNIPIEQLRSMLCHPELDRIVPQLRGVAAWLGRRADVLQLIQETDAELLFSVDLTMHDASTRQGAVDAVLVTARRGEMSDAWLTQHQYRRLAHPSIAVQVLPIIQDRSRSWLERRVAIDIAENCCLPEAESALLDLVMDSTEDLSHRSNALHAICHSQTTDIHGPLRQLLDSRLTEDDEDNLRGGCLRVLWPTSMSTTDLLPYLTPPRHPSYFGTYRAFLERDLLERLPDQDLPRVLDWMDGLRGSSLRRDEVWCSTLRDQVIVRAWESNESDESRSRLGRAFWPILTASHQWDLRVRDDVQRLAESSDHRRRLISALLSTAPDIPHPAREMVGFVPRIVTEDDVSWLIDLLDGESDARIRGIIAGLLSYFILGTSTATFDQILIASERHPALRAKIAFDVEAVEIDSPVAERMRERHRETEERRREDESQDVNPQELIERSLEATEAGRHHFWMQLADSLTLTPTCRHCGDVHRSDVTSLPGWENADEPTRQRIVAAAQRYLLIENPRTNAWFDDPNLSGGDWAIAGVKALRLCRDAAPEAFESLPGNVWETWLPAIFDFLANNSDEQATKRELLAEAYKRVPESFLVWLRRFLVRASNRCSCSEDTRERGERIPFEREIPTDLPCQLSACWSPQIVDLLRAFADESSTSLTVRANVVDELVHNGDTATIESLNDRLGHDVPEIVHERERARSDAASLMLHVPDVGIVILNRLEATNPDFCRDVAHAWASQQEFTDEDVNSRSKDETLADFYLMLRRLIPPEEDPRIEGAHRVTPSELIGRKSDLLLQTLVSRATSNGVAQVRRIADALLDDLGLRLTLLDAQRRFLHGSWSPLEPSDVLAMVRNRQNRVVRSGQELIAVLIQTISRFEAELQGETPQNFTLWDKQQPRKVKPTDEKPSVLFRPKEEERLSDALRRHFERDLRDQGIITNREVEIRPRQGTGGHSGERTDIHVDAVSQQHHQIDRIRVIVEVKGCWNREVGTAMASQLRDRYLKDNDCCHGLYVVGWHICDQWDAEDCRRRDAIRLMPDTLDKARRQFADQAESESSEEATLAAVVLNCALR